MGKRTSIYYSDELFAAIEASGVPAADLIWRGLGVEPPGAPATREDVREIVRDEVRSALRDAQGGAW